MNLHALRQFTSVVQTGSVTNAAKALHISQPAITMQIRNLEKELGVTLFRAKGRGIQLTDAGEFIYQEARKLFSVEEEVERKIEQYTNGVTGKVRLFATNFPASYLVPGWIAGFKNLYPSVDIDLSSGHTERAIEKLKTYEVDIAIIASHFPIPDDIETTSLLKDELSFIVPKNHPLASGVVEFNDLTDETFILRGEGSSTKALVESLCRVRQIRLKKEPVKVERMEEAVKIVASGYGITLAPTLVIAPYLEEEQIDIVQLKDVQISREIKLCLRKGDSLAPVAGNLRDFILQEK
ncbi:LysR family transcriptional regulator [Jeotgalibacillus haloalkalitolerans]|uniref:LysR family transcriptional regulator n=1 Tax=Jeotgalibacillus haloalkalitolerans TaxID=3104292 RepID=A0ABU5KPE5_9BACL|nr:LysR family transcriptional regulator [Jeotgalibacillus sp. HH7-29]MDZ5712606.1 LysR family transcriptional regulator [Jeotgalibacillus sp. HH7-29]